MNRFRIRPIKDEDRKWVAKIIIKEWGSAEIVTRGRIHHADKLPGFIAEIKNEVIGLITYHIDKGQCQIVTLNSLIEKKGIGRALVGSVKNAASDAGCKRLWLITTNDNTYALRYYQKLGFRVMAYHIDAIEQSRKLKPEIAHIGMDSIPIRDEIELEMIIRD